MVVMMMVLMMMMMVVVNPCARRGEMRPDSGGQTFGWMDVDVYSSGLRSQWIIGFGGVQFACRYSPPCFLLTIHSHRWNHIGD